MSATGMDWCDVGTLADMLRVGEENYPVIEALAPTVPEYVETTTGYPAELLAGDHPHETAKQLARFLVQLWFNPDGSDARQVRQVVSSLTYALKALVQTEGIGNE